MELNCHTRRVFALAFIAAAAFAVYSNSFYNSLQYDDFREVEGNEDIHEIRNIPRILLTFGDRPLFRTSLALNYRVGGDDPFGYHVVNVLIHIGVCLLAYGVADLTLRAAGREHDGAIPFLTGIAFAVHPLQTMAVNLISCRSELLCAFFYLLAVASYLRGRLARNIRGSAPCFILAGICFLLALGSKSIAITLPGIVVLYEAIFFQKRLKPILLFIAAAAAIALCVIFLLWNQVVQPFHYRSVYSNILTQSVAVCRYLRLLILPTGLRIEYIVDAIETIWDATAVAAIVLLALLIAAALLALRRYPIFSFAVLWFFVTISASSTIIPRKAILCEYRTYLPSFGFLFLAAISLSALAQRGRVLRAAALIGGAAWVLLLGQGTLIRNADYQTPITLWTDNLEKEPGLAIAHNNIGAYHLFRSNLPAAFDAFRKALDADPKYALAHKNLGMVYYFRYWQSNDPAFLQASMAELVEAIKWAHTSRSIPSPLHSIANDMDTTLREIGAIGAIDLLAETRGRLAFLQEWLSKAAEPCRQPVRKEQIGLTTFYMGVCSYYAFLQTETDRNLLAEARARFAEARDILGKSEHVKRIDKLVSTDERLRVQPAPRGNVTVD
ncbi:MAG: hypothetical protein AB1696_03305 [Planctomycetota bacterium]